MKRSDVRFVDAWAVFSDARRWRYSLGRVWEPKKPLLGWVALNPSDADVADLDPTTWRMVEFSMKFGYGGFALCNLYALVSTDPKGLWSNEHDPVGAENDAWLRQLVRARVEGVIVAWGTNAKRDRVYDVTKLLTHEAEDAKKSLWCLRKTTGKLPQPEHPLYLPGSLERIAWL